MSPVFISLALERIRHVRRLKLALYAYDVLK
jgi:hypothetical protein